LLSGACPLVRREVGFVFTALLRGEGVAAVVPNAFVVSRAVAIIKIAVHATALGGGTAHTWVEAWTFSVVAGTKALWVAKIDQAVSIVVFTVTTLEDFAVTGSKAADIG